MPFLDQGVEVTEPVSLILYVSTRRYVSRS
jgi:hypothetical protein